MKTMKVMSSFMIVFMFVFISSSISAQTDAENHAKFSSLNKAIVQHTNTIATGEAKSKNEQIAHYNEARKSFIEAKKTNSLLKKVIPENAKSEAVVHHDNIDKYYSAALPHINAMLEELKNENSDDAKLKDHAKKIHDNIELAEKEHQLLLRDTQ